MLIVTILTSAASWLCIIEGTNSNLSGVHCMYAIMHAGGWYITVPCRCSQCNIAHWWWVPVIAPMVGGAIAAPIYWLFVEANHPPLQDEEEIGVVQGKASKDTEL